MSKPTQEHLEKLYDYFLNRMPGHFTDYQVNKSMSLWGELFSRFNSNLPTPTIGKGDEGCVSMSWNPEKGTVNIEIPLNQDEVMFESWSYTIIDKVYLESYNDIEFIIKELKKVCIEE